MIHRDRIWCVVDREPEALAADLTAYSWTLCTGFRCRGYLFLNDSSSEGGAQEYAVVRESDGQQVESITFSWCSYQEALAHIQDAVSGRFDGQARPSGIVPAAQVQSPRQHGTCPLCA